MSNTEVPADTEAQQILAGLSAVGEKLDRVIEGLNSLGANQQWLVDNVQGLFQMFSSPHFMGQIQGLLMGGMNPVIDAEVVDTTPEVHGG